MAKPTRKAVSRVAKVSKPARSLTQFVRDQKRKGCPVCALPPDVLAEVRSAREKRISRPVVIEWLKVEHGITIPAQAFDSHVNARHDAGLDEGTYAA